MKGRCTNCHWAMDQRGCNFNTIPHRASQQVVPVTATIQLPTMPVPNPPSIFPHRPPMTEPPLQAVDIHEPQWSEDPTIQDPALIQAARGMSPMRPKLIQHVVVWLESEWTMNGLAALNQTQEGIDIDISCRSPRPNYELPHETEQMHIGSVIEWLGYLEELNIEHDQMLAQQRRVVVMRGRIEKLVKHNTAAAELLGFVEELHLMGDNVQHRRERQEKVRVLVRRMQERVNTERQALASLRRYIKARALELGTWYASLQNFWLLTSEEQCARLDNEIMQIPFALCTDAKEREEMGWHEASRGPSVKEEDSMKFRRLANLQSGIARTDAKNEQEVATLRRLLKARK